MAHQSLPQHFLSNIFILNLMFSALCRSARDMWKKKYFEEKKKTAPLEENSNRLRQELEALHRRLMNTLEGPKEKNARLIDSNPSQKVFLFFCHVHLSEQHMTSYEALLLMFFHFTSKQLFS